MANLYAGTSGFSYATWKPLFYPADLPSTRFLDYYAARLNAVEANYTFRTLASAKTFEAWVKKTPAGFLFCPKAHMRITHILKLRNAEEATATFLASLEPLAQAKRLGPILFQLPPNFKCDVETLTGFLRMLPRNQYFAFEFRHPSWFDDAVYQTLREYNAGLCIAESEKLATPEVFTANFVYYRLRKAEYSVEERRALGAKMAELIAQGKDVYLFFKHEDDPAGAVYAEELLGGVS